MLSWQKVLPPFPFVLGQFIFFFLGTKEKTAWKKGGLNLGGRGGKEWDPPLFLEFKSQTSSLLLSSHPKQLHSRDGKNGWVGSPPFFWLLYVNTILAATCDSFCVPLLEKRKIMNEGEKGTTFSPPFVCEPVGEFEFSLSLPSSDPQNSYCPKKSLCVERAKGKLRVRHGGLRLKTFVGIGGFPVRKFPKRCAF